MAVIKDYINPKIGCRVRVHDDYIRDVPPEEMARRRRELDRTIAQLLQNPVTRENLRQLNREKYGIE